MSREPIAQLSHGMIGRTRTIGRDPLGRPMEETIPAVRGIWQYDRAGNRVHTPTHSHRAFVKSLDDHVRPRVRKDLLQAGFLEEGVCPYTPRESLDGQPAVTPPPGFNDRCDGIGAYDEKEALGGCSHLRDVVRQRRAQSKQESEARKPAKPAAFSPADAIEAVLKGLKGQGGATIDDAAATKIADALAKAFGAPPAGAAPAAVTADVGPDVLAAARGRGKEGRGER